MILPKCHPAVRSSCCWSTGSLCGLLKKHDESHKITFSLASGNQNINRAYPLSVEAEPLGWRPALAGSPEAEWSRYQESLPTVGGLDWATEEEETKLGLVASEVDSLAQ